MHGGMREIKNGISHLSSARARCRAIMVHETVKAKFWPLLSDKRPQNDASCGVFARERLGTPAPMACSRIGERHVSIKTVPHIQQSSKTVFDSGFQVSSFGFRVSCFGFRVSGFGLRVSCFGFRTPMPMSASSTRSTTNLEVRTTSPKMPMFHARHTFVRDHEVMDLSVGNHFANALL